MHNKMSFILMALLSGVLLPGCAVSELLNDEQPLYHSTMMNHFVSPEVGGKLYAGRAAISFGGQSSVRLVSDLDDAAYNNDLAIKNVYGYNGLFDFGLGSKFDLFYENGLGIKIQLFGQPRLKSQQGNQSFSVAVSSVAVDTATEAEDSTGSVKRAEGEIEGRGYQIQLIYGERTTDRTLVYGGPYYVKSEVTKTHIFQTNNTSWTSAADVNSGEGETYGAHLGVMYVEDSKFWNTFSVTYGANISYAYTKWNKTWPGEEETKSHDSGGVGAIFGVVW